MNRTQITVRTRFHVIGKKNIGKIQAETCSVLLKSEKFQNRPALTLETFKSNYSPDGRIPMKRIMKQYRVVRVSIYTLGNYRSFVIIYNRIIITYKVKKKMYHCENN